MRGQDLTRQLAVGAITKGPNLCHFCDGRGVATAVDSIRKDGSLVNPRAADCIVCGGTGLIEEESDQPDHGENQPAVSGGGDHAGEVCLFCGRSYEDHRDEPLASGAVPKMPCLGLKAHFVARPEPATPDASLSASRRSPDFTAGVGWAIYQVENLMRSGAEKGWSVVTEQRLAAYRQVRAELEKGLA